MVDIVFPTTKISGLPSAGTVLGGDHLIVNQGDGTKTVTLDKVVQDTGIMQVVFFQRGGTLASKKDIAYSEADKKYYSWNGTYPKALSPNSTPIGSGGISDQGWKEFGGAGGGSGGLGLVGSWSDLSKTPATSAGQRVTLASWHTGNNAGGGDFVAVSGTIKDDGGVSCPAGSTGFYWKRLGDASEFDVTMFGAKDDGKTDCMPAIKAMQFWLSSKGDPIRRSGIRFPAGSFAVSSWDYSDTVLSRFRMTGATDAAFGYMASTQLNLIGPANSIAFKVNARRTEITGFVINGQYDKDSIVRHFYKNTVAEGAYVRLSVLDIANMGGRCFEMQDTLDAKFDQFYTSNCYDNIFRVLASNIKSWTHSTAVEISNFNIQGHMGATDQQSALFIPNCTQSVIWNGWIEHSTFPGNLTLGQWNLQSLSLEDCKNPLYLGQSRFTSTLHSNPGGRGIDVETDMTVNAKTGEYETRGVSGYEKGFGHWNTYGMQLNTSLRYEWLAATRKVSNITGNPVWVRIGHVFTPELAQISRIKAIGRGSYNAASASGGSVVAEATIAIQNRQTTDRTVSWSCTPNNTPVLDVKYTQLYARDVDLYVQIPAYSVVGFVIETNGPTRYDSGAPFGITWDMAVVSDMAAISGLQEAPETTSVGTRAVNMLFDGENKTVTLNAPIKNFGELNTLDLHINGGLTSLPFYEAGAGALKFPVYYLSALPAAAGNYWSICILRGPFACSDGTPRATQPVFSDGANWRPLMAPNVTVTLQA